MLLLCCLTILKTLIFWVLVLHPERPKTPKTPKPQNPYEIEFYNSLTVLNRLYTQLYNFLNNQDPMNNDNRRSSSSIPNSTI